MLKNQQSKEEKVILLIKVILKKMIQQYKNMAITILF
jgi:hypothetical protein